MYFPLRVSFLAIVRVVFFLFLFSASGLVAHSQVNIGAQANIGSFSLIDVRNGEVIPGYESIANNSAIPSSVFPKSQVAVRANTNPTTVKKVDFFLNGQRSFIDQSPPYSLFGDDGGNYFSQTLQVARYDIVAIPYDKETLQPGGSSSVSFTVLNAGTTPTVSPTPSSTPSSPSTTQSQLITSFSLIDVRNGGVIPGYESITNNSAIPSNVFPKGLVAVRANTNPKTLGRIDFFLNGQRSYLDKSPPYSLFGDDGGNYFARPVQISRYDIVATPYDKETLQAKDSSSVSFSVISSGDSQPVSPTASPTPNPTPRPSATPIATPTPGLSLTGPAVFPGARGFGTSTKAGSGRHLSPASTAIVRVNSLADSGSGSLRDCAERSGPRTCIFDISGRIALSSAIKITQGYLTIAGQTAPSPGIMLTGSGVIISASDVLVQHLQIRPGGETAGSDPGNRDGISIGNSKSGVKNVVLDHLSISWAVDENIGTWYPNTSDITISNSIISEALYNSIHPKGSHSMGLLIGDYSKQVSVHHSLLAFNDQRNPRMKPDISLEFVNNVVYGWGAGSGTTLADCSDYDKTGLPVLANFIGNYYKPGAWSRLDPFLVSNPVASGTRLYVLSNVGPSRTASEWSITNIAESPYRSLTPVLPSTGLVGLSPLDTFQVVTRKAGSRSRESNSVDSRVISEVSMGVGGLKDCVAGCARSAGGWPILGVNTRKFPVPAQPFADDDADGYTNLEEALQSAALAVEN